jgi:hypothetical protein
VTGERIVERILTKEEAYPGAHNRLAPDLTLVLKDHGFISILDKHPVIQRRPHIEGTHYPEGIFMARGPGIQKEVALHQRSILEIAPVLLHSLGLPIPSDLEKMIPSGVFDEEFLKSCPALVGPPTRPPDPLASTTPMRFRDEDEEAQIYKQMQALGYME